MIKNTKAAIALAAGMSLSGAAQAGWWDDVTDWVDNAVEDTGNWIEGAAEDSVDWVSGAWEDSVDWTSGAWNSVEDFYAEVRNAAGTAISYGEGGINTVALIVGNAVESTVSNYDYGINTNDWRVRALRLQNKIDHQETLDQALFLGTHNSYNAKEYSTSFSYLDPNHYMSMYDQLDAGMVSLEIDVHEFTKANSFWVWEWSTELTLCHGQSQHEGCSTYDRALLEGLSEIELWLSRNPEDVILIYLEDHMDGQYDKAIKFIDATIGRSIYRPEANVGCQEIPRTSLSKQDVLDSGKQVILYAGGAVCSAPVEWQNMAFSGGTGKRSFEDRTGLSSIWGAAGDGIQANEMATLMEEGHNWIGLDMLGYADTDRITAAIWSWDVNEPNNSGNQDCAVQWGNGRWDDANCDGHKYFACENDNGDWLVTNATGPWSQGEAICENESQGEYHFSVPTSYIKNQKLIQAKANVGVSDAWLAYSDLDNEGSWQGLGNNTNLAQGKYVQQSSQGWSGNPERAVDNNSNGQYSNNSVTHTQSDMNAWWQVDLGLNANISGIQIFNRTDCCTSRLRDYSIFVSNTPFSARSYTELLNDSDIWHYKFDGTFPAQVHIAARTQGRYVRIQLDHQDYLSLAEVRVLGNDSGEAVLPSELSYAAGQLKLTTGQSIETSARKLVLQGDGNLVIYSKENGAALWASHTVGSGATNVYFQGDGNLVIYASGRAVWASNTVGATNISLQSDGNFVIYQSGSARWASGSQ